MANFIRGTDSKLTPLQHSDYIFKEYLAHTNYTPLMGKVGSNKPIIVDTALQGKKGDTIRYHFIPQNKTDGIKGQDASILGNEDTLNEFYMDLKIDEMAKAFAKKGKITDKRIIWNFRDQATQQLINWFRDRTEIWITDAMTGYIENGYDYVANLNNAPLVNGEGRCIRAKGSDSYDLVKAVDSSNAKLGTTMNPLDKVNCNLLDQLSILAKKGNSTYRIAPYRTEDEREVFILYLSLKAARDLKQDPEFQKYKLALIQGGMISKDPVAIGALGLYDNILVIENERIREFSNAKGEFYARNLLVGANAMVIGNASTIDYTEELTDHKRRLSVAADEIKGQKKYCFNGIDMGVAQVITASI